MGLYLTLWYRATPWYPIYVYIMSRSQQKLVHGAGETFSRYCPMPKNFLGTYAGLSTIFSYTLAACIAPSLEYPLVFAESAQQCPRFSIRMSARNILVQLVVYTSNKLGSATFCLL